MERWIVATKRADFYGLAKELEIDPVTVRLLRNRDLTTKEEMKEYLNPSLERLNNPYLLKDVQKAAKLILFHIEKKSKIMIANDFDCDGISSGYILEKGLSSCGADVYVDTPDRCKDGYGINERLVREAYENGVHLIITCDNGIAAHEPIKLAKNLGMDVIVTDHHEVPFDEETKKFILPVADAIVNPKQEDCSYPFKGICGATVTWKLMIVLYDLVGKPKEEIYEFLEIVGMATVTDVMELKEENRILVSLGLKQMRKTKNLGLKALMEVNKIAIASLSSYHIGFIIGPCLNASGRLDTAKKALNLLKSTTKTQAISYAEELKALNESRKSMTLEQTQRAMDLIEHSSLKDDKVLIVVLKGCHESLAGIIAGRIREHYNRPTIVLTNVENGYKGSGRSIPAYNMFAEVNKQKHLLTRFGGHPMACGLSIEEKDIEEFRTQLNKQTTLTFDDFIPIISIDMVLPPEYITKELINEFSLLEPFGNGNTKPIFVGKDFSVKKAQVLGANKNVLKFQLSTKNQFLIPAIYFGDPDEVLSKIQDGFGMDEYGKMMKGEDNQVKLMLTFYPQINEFRGVQTIQLVIQNLNLQL